MSIGHTASPLDTARCSLDTGRLASWGLASMTAFLSNMAVRVLFLPSCSNMASALPLCIDERHLEIATSQETRLLRAFNNDRTWVTCWLPKLVKYPTKLRETYESNYGSQDMWLLTRYDNSLWAMTHILHVKLEKGVEEQLQRADKPWTEWYAAKDRELCRVEEAGGQFSVVP